MHFSGTGFHFPGIDLSHVVKMKFALDLDFDGVFSGILSRFVRIRRVSLTRLLELEHTAAML